MYEGSTGLIQIFEGLELVGTASFIVNWWDWWDLTNQMNNGPGNFPFEFKMKFNWKGARQKKKNMLQQTSSNTADDNLRVCCCPPELAACVTVDYLSSGSTYRISQSLILGKLPCLCSPASILFPDPASSHLDIWRLPGVHILAFIL